MISPKRDGDPGAVNFVEEEGAEYLHEGQKVLATGRKLKRSFQDVAVSMRQQLEGDQRYELGKPLVATWRQNVKVFAQQIDMQLQFCKALRQNPVLTSLMQKTPEEEEAYATQQFLCRLKTDIRSLHLLYEDINKSAEPNSPPVASEDDFVSTYASRSSSIRLERAQSLESDLVNFPVFAQSRTNPAITENISPTNKLRVNNSTSVPLSSRPLNPQPPIEGCSADNGFARPGRTVSGTTAVSHNNVRELVEKQHDLLCAVLKGTIAQKTTTEYKLGFNDPEKSDETNVLMTKFFANSSQLTRLIVVFIQEMKHLINVLEMLGYVRDGGNIVDELEQLRTDAKTSAQAHKAALKQVHLLEEALKSIKEERAPANQKHLAGKQLLRIEEARQKLLVFEQRLINVQGSNAKLLLENGRLQDELEQVHQALRMESKTREEEQAYMFPRIEYLEEIVQTTASSFEHLSLDVELLSNMYAGACAQLENRSSVSHKLRAEMQTITEKFRDLLKRMQDEKKENKRKDRIITALMGARHEMVKSVKEAQAKTARADQELADAQNTIHEQQEQLRQAELEIARLRESREDAEKARYEIASQLKQANSKTKALKAKHNAEVADLQGKIAQLETAGMDQATRDAYDEMKLRLKHAVAAYQKLEKQLQDSKAASRTD